jgi:hypothetical protein
MQSLLANDNLSTTALSEATFSFISGILAVLNILEQVSAPSNHADAEIDSMYTCSY